MTDLTDIHGCHKCGFMRCTCLDIQVMPKDECKHVWDKATGIRVKGRPHIGIKGYWLRTCVCCGRKERWESLHVPGFSAQGWYSFAS